MRILCVQLQPRRVNRLSIRKVCALMLQLALEAQVRSFAVQRSRSPRAYLNFIFESPTVENTWLLLRARALHHPKIGRSIREASIVICQGSRAWDNYRLLHHFDRRQPLDSLRRVRRSRAKAAKAAEID